MTTRTTNFTGTELVAWPSLTPSGSWTHTTDNATVGSPNNVVETIGGSQRGRARVAASTTLNSRRSHHADFAGYQQVSAEVRVYVFSRVPTGANTPSVCLSLHTAGTAANSDRYEARFGSDNETGKDVSLGAAIIRVVGGVASTVAFVEYGSSFDEPSYYAFRAIKRGSDVLLQAVQSSSPITDWSSALTGTDSTAGLWDAAGGVAIGERYEQDPVVQTSIYYDDFSTTDIQPILATGIAATSVVGSPTVNITSGPLTISPTGIASTSTFGSPTVTPGARTITLSGIPATSSVGVPAVTPGAVTIAPIGISGSAVFGASTLNPGAISRTPSGISSTVVFGVPVVGALLTQFVAVTSVTPATLFGSAYVESLIADLSTWTVTIRDPQVIQISDHKVITVREPEAMILR